MGSILEQPDTANARDLPKLAEELRREIRRRPLTMVGKIAVATGVGAVLAGLLIIVALIYRWERPGLVFVALGPLMGGPGLTYLFWPSRRERTLVGRLVEVDDVEAVPVLIEAMSIQNIGLRNQVIRSLCRLMPLLGAENRSWYQDCHRKQFREALKNCLNRPFEGNWPPDYAIAVLRAVRVLEDTSLLPVVRSLAEVRRRDAKAATIRDEAGSCLAVLTVAADQQQQREQLLRPSGEGGSQALLHVVVASDQEQSESLLRPVN